MLLSMFETSGLDFCEVPSYYMLFTTNILYVIILIVKTFVIFLDQLEKAGLDVEAVEAFSVLSGPEKARIAAAMVAVMKAPSDSGQTVVMRPPPAQQGNDRKMYVVSKTSDLSKVECSAHREWPPIGVVAIGTEMCLGDIGDVGPGWRLANPAEMLWYVAAVTPKTSFIGERAVVHGKGYQLLLKLRDDGSWTQEFGTMAKGGGHFPALLVKINNEDYII